MSSIFNGSASKRAVIREKGIESKPIKGKEKITVLVKKAREPSTVLFLFNGFIILPFLPINVEHASPILNAIITTTMYL